MKISTGMVALRFLSGVTLLTGWLLGASAAATAGSILPDYSALTECSSGQLGLLDGTASCSQADANGGDNLTVNLLPFAGLTSNATVAGGVLDSFGAFGVLDYSFEVVGGSPGGQVPLIVFANLFTSVAGGGNAYTFSEILVSTALASNQGMVACTACGAPYPASFSGAISVAATSGSINQLHLEIDIHAGPVGQAGESVTAIADPLIYIDPSFAGAGDYSILLSPGVANATASTPEPGTLILVWCCLPFILVRGYLRLHSVRSIASTRDSRARVQGFLSSVHFDKENS